MASRLILSGLRSIEECLRVNPGRVTKLLVAGGSGSSGAGLSPRIERLCDLARRSGVSIERNPKAGVDEPVLAVMEDYQYVELEVILDSVRAAIEEGAKPLVLALDGITDPHNLGAILRTAAFMGATGVVLPKDRSAAVTDTVYRIASGGVEYLQICQATNLVSALRDLKEAGQWIVGFSEHAEQTLTTLKNDFSPVIVVGNEEKGLRPLVKDSCDFLVRLESKGGLQSLNASVAAALAMSWATTTAP